MTSISEEGGRFASVRGSSPSFLRAPVVSQAGANDNESSGGHRRNSTVPSCTNSWTTSKTKDALQPDQIFVQISSPHFSDARSPMFFSAAVTVRPTKEMPVWSDETSRWAGARQLLSESRTPSITSRAHRAPGASSPSGSARPDCERRCAPSPKLDGSRLFWS